MAGGLFNRIKTWIFEEVVKSQDLNAEFDNIINHLSPQFIASFSQTVGQMQTQLDPGSLGSENLAESTAQEIEQLRFVIARITGNPFWYEAPTLSLAEINTLLKVGVAIPDNRIESGRERANHQPLFLQANGTTNTLSLLATSTPFKVVIQNTEYEFVLDTLLTGMSLAPASGNTATVNNGLSALDPNSIYAGEADHTLPTLTLAGCGTNIASKVGSYAAFKVVDGSTTEYFIGYVASAVGAGAGVLTKCYRGYFFDNTDTPVQPIALTDGDTVTLLKIHYIFATTSLTITSTTSAPTYAASAPTSPSTGDYWFDLNTQIWNVYNGSSFVNANATLIGMAVTDSAGTKVSRSFEFFAPYKIDNTIVMEFIDGGTVRSNALHQGVSVVGNPYAWDQSFLEFDMPLHLTDTDGSTSEAVTTRYFMYITDLGQQVFSTVRPYDRSGDLLGSYHPYAPWRCMASIKTEGTPLLDQTTLLNKNVLLENSRPMASGQTPVFGPLGSVVVTPSCGSLSYGSTGSVYSPIAISFGLVTGGDPVSVQFLPAGAQSSLMGTGQISGNGMLVRLVRDGTVNVDGDSWVDTGAGAPGLIGPWIDPAPAGYHFYQFYISTAATGNAFLNVKVQAYEIKR